MIVFIDIVRFDCTIKEKNSNILDFFVKFWFEKNQNDNPPLTLPYGKKSTLPLTLPRGGEGWGG